MDATVIPGGSVCVFDGFDGKKKRGSFWFDWVLSIHAASWRTGRNGKQPRQSVTLK